MTVFFLGVLSEVRRQSYRLAFPLVLCVVFFACDSSSHSANENTKTTTPERVQKKRKEIPEEGMVQYQRDDGTLLSEIKYRNYIKHGLAIGYYRNGNKHTQVTYDQGLKHGPAMIYYENGKPYRETIYQYGVNQGMRKMYRKSGSIFAEIPFHQGHPGIGLKEYNLNGQLKTIYPELVIEGFDSTDVNDQYTVHVYFADRSGKAKFYMGELEQGKYLHDGLRALEVNQGKVALVYYVNPGTSVSTTINIIGVHTTRLKNPRVVQKSFVVSADNR